MGSDSNGTLPWPDQTDWQTSSFSLIMCPTAENMDSVFININRVHQPMLNIDSAGVKAFQITNKTFISVRVGKGVILQSFQKQHSF